MKDSDPIPLPHERELASIACLGLAKTQCMICGVTVAYQWRGAKRPTPPDRCERCDGRTLR